MTACNARIPTDVATPARVIIFGTNIESILPNDLPLFFKDGILIDRRNNTPMEMDGYSSYLALKALELTTGARYQAERRELVEAVTTRMRKCGGFWRHGAWSKEMQETHMRFTAAAIRLLVEAQHDGLLSNPTLIVNALKKHLSFSEELTCGTWFLHDSLETPSGPSDPRRRSKSAWGSTKGNGLVLNTHIDTLVTVIYVMRNLEIANEDRARFQTQLQSGVAALKAVLSANEGPAWRWFARIDSAVRSLLFQTYESHSLRGRILRKLLLCYFPFRKVVRRSLPHFAYPDGYLERDVHLSGTFFGYHYINVYDLARFVIQARETALVSDEALLERCEELVDSGIEYAIRSNFWTYVIDSIKIDGAAIRICEAILARMGTKPRDAVTDRWIKAYCDIRRSLSPSPAILGYDPLVVGDAEKQIAVREGHDAVVLRNGIELDIDLHAETAAIRERGAYPVPTTPEGNVST